MSLSTSHINLMGVFKVCPLKTAVENCPFKKIHSMSVAEKMKELLQLKEEEIKALLQYDYYCIYHRGKGDLEAVKKMKPPLDRPPFSGRTK